MDRRSTGHGGLKVLVGAVLCGSLCINFELATAADTPKTNERVAQLNLSRDAAAQRDTISPGQYLREAAGIPWGVLNVTRRQTSGGLRFLIESTGSNKQICQISGEIQSGTAKVESHSEGRHCEVHFRRSANGAIEVNSDPSSQACRSFCGYGALFNGTYLIPASGCSLPALHRRRMTLKSAYDRKEFRRAHQLLVPLLSRCSATLDWFQEQDIRNDLAVTLYRLGRNADCLKVMEPLIGLAQTPDELIEGLEHDKDEGQRIARAARTNLKLCGHQLEMKEAK